ncbi:winged helix-turn-helix domain-containing protein [Oceanicaulis sp. LC35]|uniref:winged helix-turn-helix domain-containing protein n=1 Tax=Oceanicaulis sp. LC35 TaxID=3349635 RepID=UPI003F87246A
MSAETPFLMGPVRVEPAINRITGESGPVELEPQVMDLLVYLAEAKGEVRSKDQIAAALWPDASVNEDALSRTVWKLRQALGDDAKAPRFVQTVSRRGYRLIMPVEPMGADAPPVTPKVSRSVLMLSAAALVVVLVGARIVLRQPDAVAPHVAIAPDETSALLDRADGFYAQYTRSDNEAALRLYERVLTEDPENAAALAGLANALTQRVIRWGLDGEANRTTLTEALQSGEMETPRSQAALQRAAALALEATEIDPGHARAWRALGLIRAAQSEFDAARRAYDRALVIDPENWGAMINLSELEDLSGHPERQADLLARSFEAMSRDYAANPVAIRPWQSEVGLAVARLRAEAGAPQQAELWYRRVLALDPLNADAVKGLAAVLRESGDEQGAQALCRELETAGGGLCDL